jgi:hypothetical protein
MTKTFLVFFIICIFAKKNQNMIQRIQTVYLLIAFVAAILLFFFPFARYFTGPGTHYEFYLTGMKYFSMNEVVTVMIPVFMLSFHIIITAFTGIVIFLFKNRVRQMRFVAVTFLLNIILVALLFYFSDKYGGAYDTTPNYKNIGTLLPLVMLLMLLLAQKAIKSDEVKMRKSSRIR